MQSNKNGNHTQEFDQIYYRTEQAVSLKWRWTGHNDEYRTSAGKQKLGNGAPMRQAADEMEGGHSQTRSQRQEMLKTVGGDLYPSWKDRV